LVAYTISLPSQWQCIQIEGADNLPSPLDVCSLVQTGCPKSEQMTNSTKPTKAKMNL
jgi:hypothetical protein